MKVLISNLKGQVLDRNNWRNTFGRIFSDSKFFQGKIGVNNAMGEDLFLVSRKMNFSIIPLWGLKVKYLLFEDNLNSK